MTRPSDAELVNLLRRAADRDRAATKEGVARRAEYRAAADALEAASAPANSTET